MSDLVLGGVALVGPKDSQVHAGRDDRERRLISGIDGAVVEAMAVLFEALLPGARDDPPCPRHAHTLGGNPLVEVEPLDSLREVVGAVDELVDLLRAEAVTGERERDPRPFLNQRRRQAAVAVVARRGIRVRSFFLIEIEDGIDPFVQMGPEGFFGQKRRRAAGKPQDPHVRMARIGVFLPRKLRPRRIDDLPRHHVNPMPQLPERQRHLFDVNELPAEVGMRGPAPVGRVEVALRVEEGEVHEGWCFGRGLAE